MIGFRLKQLRLARSLSLDELAAAMGGIVTKQALSKYELGKSNPSPVVLNKLASALGVKTMHLWSEPIIDCKFIAYRKGSGLAMKEQTRVESVACQMLEERVRLQRITGMNNVNLPIKQYMVDTVDSAENVANTLRARWNLGMGPIANVTDTLEDHYVHVMEIEAPDKFDGISAVAYDDEKNIAAAAVVSRKSVAGERQRFNLAHELGHLVLDIPAHIDEEKTAYRFAAAFLAPKESLLGEIGRKRAFVQPAEMILLKKKYGMSIQALIYRLHDLEVISVSHSKQWWMDINRLGWKKKEPFEMEPEQPQWHRKTILRAFSEGALTKGEAEKMLDESLKIKEPFSLIERQSFMKLSLEEKRKIMAKQAKEMAAYYKQDANREDLETGEIIDY